MGRIVRWNSKALVNYTRCRTGKGNLLKWKQVLDPDLEDTWCKKCDTVGETGAHVALYSPSLH